MNGTHALTAAGSASFGSALAAVIAGSFGLSPDLAAAWVVVGTGVLSALGSLVVWYVRWRWPDAPLPPVGEKS